MLTSIMEGIDADIFPSILTFYVRSGSRILDSTCGKRIFWRKINPNLYSIVFNDIRTEVNPDSTWDVTNRDHPFTSRFDAIVFDPPHLNYSKTSMFYVKYGSTRNLGRCNSLSEMLIRIPTIFYSLLKRDGIVIAKIFDDRNCGKVRFRHVELYESMKDHFDLIDVIIKSARKQKDSQKNWRGGRKPKPHALQIHSYFMVFRRK